MMIVTLQRWIALIGLLTFTVEGVSPTATTQEIGGGNQTSHAVLFPLLDEQLLSCGVVQTHVCTNLLSVARKAVFDAMYMSHCILVTLVPLTRFDI